jgi:probable selenium-dependent hydroxylase accessory protein YqeC
MAGATTAPAAARPGASTRPLAEALGLTRGGAQGGGRAPLLAFVGAGGKTSAIFALARELEELRIIVTTTTKLRDPRGESHRAFDRLVLEPGLALAPGPAYGRDGSQRVVVPAARGGAGALVVASGVEAGSGKLVGIHPTWVDALRAFCDLLLVEADGSRGLPIKAPADWEPVIPEGADMVVGLVGLDCLNRGLGPESAQRPEILGPLVGCARGESLGPEHLLRLAASPLGLFKGAPAGARRAIILNKAESAPTEVLRRLVEGLAALLPAASPVLACELRDGEGPQTLLAAARVSGGEAP